MQGDPLVVLVAGPNGAGKSTTAAALLKGALAVSEFVNADTIAQGISSFRPETVAITAGRVMLARIHALAAARESFAFESTLASRSFAPWLRRLKGQGYKVHVEFLSLANPDLAVARVAARVQRGGHAVPEEVVRRRFTSGLVNFFELYQPVADSWQMLDNAGLGGPRVIAFKRSGYPVEIRDAEAWQHLVEIAR
jgi:predicted ABC-type ATPase